MRAPFKVGRAAGPRARALAGSSRLGEGQGAQSLPSRHSAGGLTKVAAEGELACIETSAPVAAPARRVLDVHSALQTSGASRAVGAIFFVPGLAGLTTRPGGARVSEPLAQDGDAT